MLIVRVRDCGTLFCINKASFRFIAAPAAPNNILPGRLNGFYVTVPILLVDSLLINCARLLFHQLLILLADR